MGSPLQTTPPPDPTARRALPLTFWVGLGFIAFCELFLFLDVTWSDRTALRHAGMYETLSAPQTALEHVARWVAVNMTPLAWTGYLLVLEGVLFRLGESPVRRRPHHFALLFLSSIVIWCVFDWVNFYFIEAWSYLGVPLGFRNRFWGYVLAFGAIVPGMLMTGQVLLRVGAFNWANARAWTMPGWGPWLSLVVGSGMFIWPLVARDPITNFTLWTSLVFLLDPINYWLGRPSMLRDWHNGWYGRTLAAFAGGLLCGFLWEFWNYWAIAKWIYHLPFLGPLEQIRYFEMPLPGLLGFLPFGMECWVMWQTIRLLFDGLAEPLPDDRHLI